MSEIESLNDAFGDPSRTDYRVVTDELRNNEAPKWSGWKTRLAAADSELQSLEVKGATPGANSILEPFLVAYGTLIQRTQTLCGQGMTAMDQLSGMLLSTADFYQKLEEYNRLLAKSLNRGSGP